MIDSVKPLILFSAALFLGGLGGCLAGSSPFQQSSSGPDANALPRIAPPFAGQLAQTEEESTGAFVPRPEPAENAPNILLILTDDAGFGAASTFGGPAPTPHLDQLAAEGLRYNRFHTTGVCSPTRAALLTGRNHHAVGMGALVEMVSPYPGYSGRIPASAATMARVLRDNGYNTAMFGKDHNVPPFERSSAGPFDHWPTGRLRGFEHFYGFVAGDADQWNPPLFENTSPVDASGRPKDYLLDRDLADHLIGWIHNQKAAAADKPFFAYLSTASPHAPHQALPEWIAKFRGRFDHGWDRERAEIIERQKRLGVIPQGTAATPRPDFIPAWDSLSESERKVHARFMEVFAAQLAYQDHQIGRVLDEIERMGLREDTLVVFIEGDNGASAEGGIQGMLNEMPHISTGREHPVSVDWLAANLEVLGSRETYQGFAAGWSWATSAPFPWFKQVASHLGGVRNGLVLSWPGHIEEPGAIRTQYHHVIDVLPTLLEAAGITAPKTVDGVAQQRIDGTSMLYSFADPEATSPRTTQYYEINGNHAIYHEDWLASTTPRNMPWDVARPRAGSDTSTYTWELYDLRADFAQSRDLAEAEPERLRRLREVFDQEARRNNVYPVHDSGAQTRARRFVRATQTIPTRRVFWGPDISLSAISSPPIFSLPFSVEAEIVVPRGGGQGVVVAAGSYFGGWSFFLDQGRPTAVASVSPLPGGQSRVTGNNALSEGAHELRFDFTPEKGGPGGTMRIAADGRVIAEGPITERPRVLAGGGETLDTGRDTNDPVSRAYKNQGRFDGELRKVIVDVYPPTGKTASPVDR
ncbi:MAG: arylsulfatase [Myxococcota bacterium]